MKTIHVGSIGTAISGPLRDEFISLLLTVRESTAEDVILDFQGVSSLSSISLASVGKLHTWMEEHGRRLYIVNLEDHVSELFVITGLSTILHLGYPDPV